MILILAIDNLNVAIFANPVKQEWYFGGQNEKESDITKCGVNTGGVNYTDLDCRM